MGYIPQKNKRSTNFDKIFADCNGKIVKKFKQNRAAWYLGMKKMMKIRHKKTAVWFWGDAPTNGSVIVSNHEGTDAAMALEIYCQFSVRMGHCGNELWLAQNE